MKFLTKTLAMLLVVPELIAAAAAESSNATTYGLDVSFPIHGRVSDNYLHLDHNVDPSNHPRPTRYEKMPLQPLGNRQATYLQYLDGCRSAYTPSTNSYSCDDFEYDRMVMNRRQPQSMVNLTKTGFQKIRAPPNLKDLIDDFWQKNQDKGKREAWQSGNSYVNHWSSPTTLVSVDDMGLRGSGGKLKEHIWAAASATMEEWTNQELQPCSLYGIRVYKEGAIMLPHVDRLPLVASAIISVAVSLVQNAGVSSWCSDWCIIFLRIE
jgi:prolyl 4-hydroxylase